MIAEGSSAARSSPGRSADWATDFSHLEPEWSADPYPIQDDLRQRCPIAHTDRFGGGWLPVRYEDVAAIAYDTEHFSSRAIIMSNFRPPPRPRPGRRLAAHLLRPAIPSDARKLLLPAFTKTAIAKQEAATRAFCHSLIDAFAGQDVVDAARDYAQHIPMRVIADMLGFPPEDGPRFREFVEDMLEGINLPAEERIERMDRLFDYLLDAGARPPRPPARRPDELPDQRRDLRPQAGGGPRHRDDGAAAHRRDRHDLERDRRVAVAPGQDARPTWSGW